jgi:hypothetical protein
VFLRRDVLLRRDASAQAGHEGRWAVIGRLITLARPSSAIERMMVDDRRVVERGG